MSLDRVSRFWPETLSIVRFVIGLMFVEHGTAKLFAFPHTALGQPEFASFLWFQGVLEIVGGLLFAVGFLTRPNIRKTSAASAIRKLMDCSPF